MACDKFETSSEDDSNLMHVYFFIDRATSNNAEQKRTSARTASNMSAQTRSRTPSPGSNSAETASRTTASTTHSDMNPLAQEFTPSPKKAPAPATPPEPCTNLLYELRKTPDKGFGLFATSFIKCGSLIFSEQPLLRIKQNSIQNVWGPYSNLSRAHKAIYNGLHCWQPPALNLSYYAQVFLANQSDQSLHQGNVEKRIDDRVRVMSIFTVNAYAINQGGAAVYATASRLNHSCLPNVFHSYNPTLKECTVYAARDIQPDEELFTTYIGGEGTYQSNLERNEKLQEQYGFTCSCAACCDPTGGSNGRRELMAGISWGLNEFDSGRIIQNPFVPSHPVLALKQAEDLISIMLTEGILTIELMKAYRQASTQALNLQDFNLALEYANNEAEVERNCLGGVLDDLVKCGAASRCWFEKIERVINGRAPEGKNNLHKKQKTKMAKKKKRAQEAVEAAENTQVETSEGIVKVAQTEAS